jgi:hypothetical protein
MQNFRKQHHRRETKKGHHSRSPCASQITHNPQLAAAHTRTDDLPPRRVFSAPCQTRQHVLAAVERFAPVNGCNRQLIDPTLCQIYSKHRSVVALRGGEAELFKKRAGTGLL